MFNTYILYQRTASYTTVCLNNNIKNDKITKTTKTNVILYDAINKKLVSLNENIKKYFITKTT
jgi:hypothetical protein